MLNDIMLGQYFPGNSFVHRLDPRTKILLTLVFISSIFLAQEAPSYVLLICLSAGIVAVGGIPVRIVLKSIRPLWWILAITALIHFFLTPGTPMISLGPVTITEEGLRQGILMSVRLVLLILVSSLLTFTTSPIALTDGIERLLAPFAWMGLPAHELAMMMTIALRFIPTLLEETDKIMKAQMARGADFSSGSPIRRAQNIVPLLVPLFIGAFRRADELATAMEARCYRGGDNRTRMKELQLGWRDLLGTACVLGLVLVLVWMRWGKVWSI